MITKVAESIQPVGAEQWLTLDLNRQESRALAPVEKSEGSKSKKLGDQKQDSETKSGTQKKTTKDLQHLVDEARNYLSEMNIDLDFKVDDKSGNMVIRVLDGETGELIRQIPPEDVLKLHDKLKELRGILFDAKA